jgi:hypothetical protein
VHGHVATSAQEISKRLLSRQSKSPNDAVRIAQKRLQWRASEDSEDVKWDIMWLDSSVSAERLLRLQLGQKVNHFEGRHATSSSHRIIQQICHINDDVATVCTDVCSSVDRQRECSNDLCKDVMAHNSVSQNSMSIAYCIRNWHQARP